MQDQPFFGRRFFETKLGQASIASIMAMAAMIAMTSQMNLVAADSNIADSASETSMLIELA